MEQVNTNDLFRLMPDKLNPDKYNFDRFTRNYFVMDTKWTYSGRGIGPGKIAPDFELTDTEGNRVRLGDLRGKPVLLHFGSFT